MADAFLASSFAGFDSHWAVTERMRGGAGSRAQFEVRLPG
jgi:hypothetical protein